MRCPGPGRWGPVAVILGAAASAILLFGVSPFDRSAAQADCSASSPCPTPTPTPTNAFLTISVTSGDATTQITVNGGAFLPNEQMTLFWDQNGHVAGGANADSSGNFVTHVVPFAGDPPGLHRLCASVPPYPCANFTLLSSASPSPTPPSSPSASPAASPSPTPTQTAASGVTPVNPTLNGFDVITRPPFVFLPIVGALAILFAFGYWAVSTIRKPKPLKIPASAVVHRATRPDYNAGFAATPPAPATTPAPPPAWDDGMVAAESRPPTEIPEAPPPAAAAEAAPQAEAAPPPEPQAYAPEARSEAAPEPPPVDWDLPASASQPGPDDPLDFPEPGED